MKFCIFWFEVKYILEASPFIFSMVGNHPLSSKLSGCPFLIIVIGSPVLPKSWIIL
jgi:hypothetical protein